MKTLEKGTKPFEFCEVLDLLSQNTDLAFTCKEFDKGQYIAFDYDDFRLSFYSGGTEIVRDDKEGVTIKTDSTKIRKQDFLITLDCFEREWKTAHLQDVKRIYNLKIICDWFFSEDDVISFFGKTFSSLSKEEKLDLFYDIMAEEPAEENPQFFVDEKPFP